MSRSASVDRRNFNSVNARPPKSIHPCQRFDESASMPYSPSVRAVHPFPECQSCPPIPPTPEQFHKKGQALQKPQTGQEMDAVIFESRYLKARCDALEKERDGWRHREAVLIGQLNAQRAEIMDLKHRMHGMPKGTRQQYQRNENMKHERGHKQRRHKQRKRNNKNNKIRSIEA